MAGHFADAPLSSHGSRWNACWERGQTGWDRGAHSEALLEVLTRGLASQNVDYLHPSLSSSKSTPSSPSSAMGHSNDNKETPDDKAVSPEDLFPGHQQKQHRKRALVPGCGRGYDVLLLSSQGYDVVGLDLSPVGVQRAKEHAEQSQRDGSYPITTTTTTNPDGGSERPGKFQFVEGDFFKDDWLHSLPLPSASTEEEEGGSGKFDLIYDYTVRLTPSPYAHYDKSTSDQFQLHQTPPQANKPTHSSAAPSPPPPEPSGPPATPSYSKEQAGDLCVSSSHREIPPQSLARRGPCRRTSTSSFSAMVARD